MFHPNVFTQLMKPIRDHLETLLNLLKNSTGNEVAIPSLETAHNAISKAAELLSPSSTV